jgi:hypothetical protein
VDVGLQPEAEENVAGLRHDVLPPGSDEAGMCAVFT